MTPHDFRPTSNGTSKCIVCGTRKRTVPVPGGALRTEYLPPRAGAWSKHTVPCRAIAAPQAEHVGAPS